MNSLWYSLVPLLAVNFFGLLSLVYYLLVAQKTASHDGFEAIENRHHSKLLGKTLKGFWFWLTSPVERLAIKWSVFRFELRLRKVWFGRVVSHFGWNL